MVFFGYTLVFVHFLGFVAKSPHRPPAPSKGLFSKAETQMILPYQYP